MHHRGWRESGEPDIDSNHYASCDIEDVEYVDDNDDTFSTDVGVTARALDLRPADAEAQGCDDAVPDDSHKGDVW